MKYWLEFDKQIEERPEEDALYYRRGGRIECKPKWKRTGKSADKLFRSQLILFIALGIGMYAVIVAALAASGVL